MPKIKLVPVLLILAMVGSAIFLYPILPNKIPTHFGISGHPDSWGGKLSIFLFPGLSILAYLLLLGLPRLDPFRQNYKRFARVYEYMEALVLLMFSFFYMTVLITIFFEQAPIDRLIAAGLSVIFIFLGNKLALVKRNFFLGIRTPWTLASDRVWVKTHRLGAKLLVVVGTIGVIGVFWPVASHAVIFVLVPLVVAVVTTTVYSYFVWRSLDSEERSALQL